MSTFFWAGGAGDFADPTQWIDDTDPDNTGLVGPGSGDVAEFVAGGEVSGSGDVAEMTVDGALSDDALITAGSLFSESDLTIDAGAALTAGLAWIGEYDDGIINVTGRLDASAGYVAIGYFADGTLAVGNGGVVATGSLFVGDDSADTALIAITGGSLTTTGDVYVGDTDSNGTIALAGGANVTVGGITEIGADTGGTGTLTIDNSTWISGPNVAPDTSTQVGDLTVGAGATGDMIVNDHATVTVNGILAVGNAYDGVASTGTLLIEGGSTVTVNSTLGLQLAEYPGSSGMLVVTGPGTEVFAGAPATAQTILVADEVGNGTITVSNQAQVVTGEFAAGWANAGDTQGGTGSAIIESGATVVSGIGGAGLAGGIGTLTVDAATWSILYDMVVGYSGGSATAGQGVLSVQDGGTITDALAAIGVQATAAGTLAVSGTASVTGENSVWATDGDFYVGDAGTGTLNVAAGGTVTATSLFVAAQAGSGTGASPSVVSITDAGSALDVTGSATLDSATGTYDITNHVWVYADSGVGTISVADGGYLSIGQALNLQMVGTTTAASVQLGAGGAIEIGGSSAPVANELNIDASGLLLGHGTIDAPTVANNGTIEAQQGSLDIAGPVIGGGTFAVDMNATLELDGTIGAGETVDFGTTPGTLDLTAPNNFFGTIDNFVQGDVLDLGDTPGLAANQLLDVSYANGTLSLGTIDHFVISGTDPVPEFSLMPDGNGGTDIESTSLPTLLDLAFDAYNTVPAGLDGYSVFDNDIVDDAGFQGVAYIDQASNGASPSIVVAIRGTDPTNKSKLVVLKNFIADAGFATGVTNALLNRYVRDADKLLQTVIAQAATQDPGAVITLTGHSLGGGVAQIAGAGANLAAAGFNAPGAALLFPQTSLLVGNVAGSGSGGTNINYRLNGDQVSLAGLPLGQVYTIASPYPSNTVASAVANFLNNHGVGTVPPSAQATYSANYLYAYQNLENPAAYSSGRTGINITGPLTAGLMAAAGKTIVITEVVVGGMATIIDPPSGTLFTLASNAGAPAISSVTLPFIPGVANYDVAYDIGGTLSTAQTIAPGVADNFPAGVDGIEIAPVDGFGNSVTIDPGFVFTLTFDASGTYTGTLTTSGTGVATGLPVVTPASLTVLPTAGPTPLGIVAPSDAAYPDPTDLSVAVAALPANGTVTLSDGVTPVTLNENLTVSELTGLTFTPTASNIDTFSSFEYSVTDPDYATTDGTAVIGVACYCRGTRILTEWGEVPVEVLVIGDRLITRMGERRALRWIGRRHYGGPLSSNARPVRIRAGAIADGVPRRDLWVSPRHALYLDHLLIPAASLVNGASIVMENGWAEVTYFHLELSTHDVIIAEGALSETYLDLDNRDMFHNATDYEALYPDTARSPARDCAPRLERGAAVDAVRAALAGRAERIGFRLPAETVLSLEATGVTRGVIPAGVGALRLRSCVGYAPGDRRVLGALVCGLRLDAETLDLRDRRLVSGFHSAERHGPHVVRWTCGDAMIAIAPTSIARRVEVEVGLLMGMRLAS